MELQLTEETTFEDIQITCSRRLRALNFCCIYAILLEGSISMKSPSRSSASLRFSGRPLFCKVDYILKQVQKEAVWGDIVPADGLWCYTDKRDFKNKLRKLYTNNTMYQSWARKLCSHIVANYSEDFIQEKVAGNSLEKSPNENEMI